MNEKTEQSKFSASFAIIEQFLKVVNANYPITLHKYRVKWS